MAIETYLIEEADALITDTETIDEWKAKVSELNLEGQQKLVNGGNSNPIPFLRITKGEQRVYEELCPLRTDVHKYSNSTIPLRVLSLIALAQKEQYFDVIEIWDNTAAPDPVAVGIKGTTYSGDVYLIARWGDELRSFAELKAIAMKQWIEKKTADLKIKLSNVENYAVQHFNGEWASI